MAETSPPEPEGSRLKRRLSLLLLLAIVFGAPALVTTSLVTQELVGEVTRGEQPGGTIAGTIVDAEGRAVEGHAVVLWVVPNVETPFVGSETATDVDGRFELRAPPVSGAYELRAGGELVQRVTKPVSFLDPKGATIDVRPVMLELLPGAVLELEFVRPSGDAGPDGSFTFEGAQTSGGLVFGLVPYSIRGSGPVTAGRLRIDGLPPMRAELAVLFDTGETAKLELRVESGLNASRVALEPPP